MNPIVRFAPSPTGYLHVGGARTAIFNWLIAKSLGGQFRVRIEDTDRERSTAESIKQIISGLEWLRLDWDKEIVYQGSRVDRHREVVEYLLESGHAYRCFCTPQELEEKRRFAERNRINKRYDGTCSRLSADQIRQRLDGKHPFSVRFRVETDAIVFNDLIHGEHRTPMADSDDFIIQRSDGSPVYQLAVVVDDHDMGINMVLRGDDHLSNTAKQILIYQALRWPVPQFGHLPLILGPDKVRLSKRHGATSVEEFREQGILPQALFNYLCLLGWNPGDEEEFLTVGQIMEKFSLQRINHTPAVFDIKKLLWLNGKHLAVLPFEELLRYTREWLAQEEPGEDPGQEESFFMFMKLLQIRSRTLTDFFAALRIYYEDPVEYDEKGMRKFFFKEGTVALLGKLSDALNGLSSGRYEDEGEIEKSIRGLAESMEMGAGKVIHPLRLALTGRTESIGIFELIHILGKDKVIRRIQRAIHFIESQT